MFVKFFAPAWFERERFASLLNDHGIDAVAVEGGVILARDAFNAIPSGELPVWAWLNKADINSPLHTRPISDREKDMVNSMFLFPTEADLYEGEPVEDSRSYEPTEEDMEDMEAFYSLYYPL